MSSAWAPLPLRPSVSLRSRAPPPSRSFSQVYVQASGSFNGPVHYSMGMTSPWRRKDYAYVPSLSCNIRRLMVKGRGRIYFATDGNEITTQASDTDSSGTRLSATDESPSTDAKPIASDFNKSESSEAASKSKRAPLTAREKLRAGRMISRYSNSKATTKSEPGSRILDLLRESDEGRGKGGLPEAPADLLDDNKRGLPKPGWTFDFPGGSDLLVIAFSFVFISTVMFATTYIVWKSGAIHYNEY